MALAPGTRLGHYEVLSPIGAGGMGEVYRARDPRLGRDVAVKVLPDHLASDETAKHRFEREARAVAALSHQNILSIFDLGTENGVAFVVTELLEGETLKETLQRGPIGWHRAIEIGMAVAEGLAAAHDKGIFHRDIKPANLFITTNGSVKILDFGLAHVERPQTSSTDETVRMSTSITQPGVIMGTVQYMSPEQVCGKPADARSDIFSLGCVLHESLSGRPTFASEKHSAIETMAAILEKPAPDLDASVPDELHQIIGHCLEKEPSRRFQSASDLAIGLRALRGATTMAQSMPQFAQRSRPARLMWSILGVNALLFALIGFNVFGLRDWLFDGSARPTGKDRIAVLPLRDLSGRDDQAYFVDGQTEELIAHLQKISSIEVISSTSARRFTQEARTDLSLPQIARELRVDWIVEGSVRTDAKKVRITATLYRGSTEQPVWSDTYDGDMHDILALQAKVARKIASEIEIRLTPEEAARLTSARRVDPAAYDSYLRGLYFANKRSPEALEEAVARFRESINLDPTDARPHALLADTYNTMVIYGMMSPAEASGLANSEVIEALQLDNESAEAHAALGAIHYALNWRWDDAEKAFRTATELNDNYALAHQRFALLLASLGRHAEAIRSVEEALSRDLLSDPAHGARGLCHLAARQYDAVIKEMRERIEVRPEFVFGYLLLGRAYLAKGQAQEAIDAFETPGMHDRSVIFLGFLGNALARTGNAQGANDALAKINAVEDVPEHESAYFRALVHVGLGETDTALDLLEESHRLRSPHMAGIKFEPTLDPLRTHPRFIKLMKAMNLPPDDITTTAPAG